MSKVFVFLLSAFCALTVMVFVMELIMEFEKHFQANVSPIIISITVIGIPALLLLGRKHDCNSNHDPNEKKES